MKTVIVFFIAGLLLFYTKAIFDFELWNAVYFLWDKGKDLLILIVLWDIVNKKSRKILTPVLWLSGIRFLWEIVSLISGVNVNNNLWVAVFFTLLSIYVLYATIKNDRN